MRNGIIVAMSGLLLLAGCGTQGDKGIPVGPKWKGQPYRISFDTKAAKPSKTGADVPAVKFTANPEALETRAMLVVKFTASGGTGKEPVQRLMIGTATDIHGAEGTLPDAYMETARKSLADYLESYCMKGKVELSVALARSSLNPQAGVDQVDDKRLSDWMPLEIVYKPRHAVCNK